MDNNKSSSAEVPGTEADVKVPTVEQIRSWMEKDLGSCITFLSALHNDAAMKDSMATFLQGRITNFRNKPDPNQSDLFPKR